MPPLTPADAIVISLFDRTTQMVQPWSEAGWLCYCVDIRHEAGEHREGNIIRVGADVGRWRPPRYRTKIAFAFSPCTNLAVSGSRWFKGKGIPGLMDGLTLFAAAHDMFEYIGAPYLLENPVSVISSHFRKPDHKFHPNWYAGYLPRGERRDYERYEKKTCLWTGRGFVMPKKKALTIAHPPGKSPLHMLPPSKDREDIRSETPRGFARAVYLANCSTEAGEGMPHYRR